MIHHFKSFLALAFSSLTLALPLQGMAQTNSVSASTYSSETSQIRSIHITPQNQNVHVKAQAFIAAPAALAFQVFTDYDQQTTYIPNLVNSRVLNRQGNRWTLEQTTQVKMGPFVKKAYARKTLDLDPNTYSITAQSLPESEVASSSLLYFTPTTGGCIMEYELLASPPDWAPSALFQATAKAQALEQLQALFQEIQRRKK